MTKPLVRAEVKQVAEGAIWYSVIVSIGDKDIRSIHKLFKSEAELKRRLKA